MPNLMPRFHLAVLHFLRCGDTEGTVYMGYIDSVMKLELTSLDPVHKAIMLAFCENGTQLSTGPSEHPEIDHVSVYEL